MNNGVKKYLLDIFNAIQFIEKQIGATKKFAEYKDNEFLKSAVERKIEIIGEALNKAVKLNPDLPITSKEKII
jgi:uncharacterized protein with HEPN domain